MYPLLPVLMSALLLLNASGEASNSENMSKPGNDKNIFTNTESDCLSITKPNQADINKICIRKVYDAFNNDSNDNTHLSALVERKNKLLLKYTENHPKITKIDYLIQKLQKKTNKKHKSLKPPVHKAMPNLNAQTVNNNSGEVTLKTDNLSKIDSDRDGIINTKDNCPTITNNQTDIDKDGVGDVCDNSDVSTECTLTQKTSTDTGSGLSVVHHDGQSFVSWRDRAKGKAGANFRYRLYRSTTPIKVDKDLKNAELIADRIVNHSGQLFGHSFFPKNRLDPERPMAIITEGGEPLPLWSGLWVANARSNGCAFYAILATDIIGNPIESIVTGINATTEPISEHVTSHKPILLYNSDQRNGSNIAKTRITDTPNLPLSVILHASEGNGGGAGTYGDYYLYFGNRSMGYQEGIPGVFSVEETHYDPPKLIMRNRDAIVTPNGRSSIQTYWFGYVAKPIYSGKRFAFPYTENRLLWTIPWVIKKYNVDPERVYVSGGSMGAWGAMTFAFRHPELFAAIYPDRPQMRRKRMLSVVSGAKNNDTLPNGENWRDHLDSVRFAKNHPRDLPFLGWNIGRRDGLKIQNWQDQVDMVVALTNNRHGFAFAWNNNGHGDASTRKVIQRWYPQKKFAKNESYPAFSNSSIDDNIGNGDPTDGDLEGGINLGFDWKVKSDTVTEWVVDISNELAQSKMSVDVTPRRRQHFNPAPESNISYEIRQGKTVLRSENVTVDINGLITIKEVEIFPSKVTTLRLIPH